jgi:nucleoside-specific outer membrane channel protein Tsx
MTLRDGRRVLVVAFVACLTSFARPALAQDNPGFSTSSITARYGRNYTEPDISEDVPKSSFTFENTAVRRYWSSYLFVDAIRSWSDADENAKEVYGEWYPSLSLRALAGKQRSKDFLRDISVTAGLNMGTRSTGVSPFAVLPGLTFELNVPGFAFFSLGAFAYIDRGRFEGQPTECKGTTWQLTPSWAAPFKIGGARLKADGFADFVGSHANCEAWILTQPRLLLDLAALWRKPGKLYVGVEARYWRNKYGISGLEDKFVLPVLILMF